MCVCVNNKRSRGSGLDCNLIALALPPEQNTEASEQNSSELWKKIRSPGWLADSQARVGLRQVCSQGSAPRAGEIREIAIGEREAKREN